MTERILSPQHLNAFRENLIREEKSAATVEKYLRDAGAFLAYSAGQTVTKEHTVSSAALRMLFLAPTQAV